MTHIRQGDKPASADRRAGTVGVAGDTAMPPGLFVLPAICAFTFRRAAKERAGSAALPWRKSRKRDPICYRVSGKFFCSVAVR